MMIPIPLKLKEKLVELDRSLHELGKNLYGRKLFSVYPEENSFVNFRLELHSDGAFTLHFLHSILGNIETKYFGTNESDVIGELDMLVALVKSKLRLVSA